MIWFIINKEFFFLKKNVVNLCFMGFMCFIFKIEVFVFDLINEFMK